MSRSFSLRARIEFQKISSLLVQLERVHTCLENLETEAEICEFENLRWDADNLKFRQKIAITDELLQDGQNQISELRFQMEAFKNLITSHTHRPEHLD